VLQLRKLKEIMVGSKWNRRVATNIHLDYFTMYMCIFLVVNVENLKLYEPSMLDK